jgi:hypothetical protein
LSVTCDRSLVFSLGTLVSSTNKTDHHDITEILLKVVLNTINQTKSYWNHWNKSGYKQNIQKNLEHMFVAYTASFSITIIFTWKCRNCFFFFFLIFIFFLQNLKKKSMQWMRDQNFDSFFFLFSFTINLQHLFSTLLFTVNKINEVSINKQTDRGTCFRKQLTTKHLWILWYKYFYKGEHV